MRFDDRVTGKLAHYAPNAKKIHIDIDPSELHKNVRADVAIAGDLDDGAARLAAARDKPRGTTPGSRASASWPAARRCATSRICRTMGGSARRT